MPGEQPGQPLPQQMEKLEGEHSQRKNCSTQECIATREPTSPTDTVEQGWHFASHLITSCLLFIREVHCKGAPC